MDIKDAIILAGGSGTRLRPLTLETPKALIPLHGKTLTEHVFDILKKNKVENIYLSIGYMKEKIKDYFGDGSKFGVKIKYIEEDEPMGTAAPLILMKKLKNTFIMLNGDDLFNLDFKKMLEIHRRNKAIATIALTEIEDPSTKGVVVLDKEKIVRFVEKPKKEEAPSNLISSGYYIMEPEVFDLVKGKKFAMVEKEVFPILAEKGKLVGYKDNGLWVSPGDFENYEKAIKEWVDIKND